jgi:hypothetical protein
MATQNSINHISNPLAAGAIISDPGASGDSYIQFDINTTGEYRLGVDDTDGDALVLSQGSALGTANQFRMSAAGEFTLPLQPSFSAEATADLTSVTGDGTTYTIVFGTESFDRTSDYDGTSTFTAPIAGMYYFNTGGYIDDITSSNTYLIVDFNENSGTLYQAHLCDPGGTVASDQYIYNAALIVELAAADTMSVEITVGGGTKIVDLLGGIATTYFSGYFLG